MMQIKKKSWVSFNCLKTKTEVCRFQSILYRWGKEFNPKATRYAIVVSERGEAWTEIQMYELHKRLVLFHRLALF